MTSSAIKPFRFMDLPRELRDQIYRLSLCSFSTPPAKDKAMDVEQYQYYERAKHSSNISLLCVNWQIYEEAYDTMVKTNCFIRIESDYGIPTRTCVLSLRIPFISTNGVAMDQFKGYAASIWMTLGDYAHDSEIALHNPPESYMLLARDLGLFCQALSDVDFFERDVRKNLEMVVVIGLDERGPPANFYTDKTQQYLLQPFRRWMGSIKGFAVEGRVSPELAAVATNEILEGVGSPEKVIEDLLAEKETGTRHYRKREYEKAMNIWLDAALEIEKIHESSSWPTLVTRGGPTFLKALAEQYFLTKLNVVHVILLQFKAPTLSPFESILAEDALRMATTAMKKGFWSEGYKWVPTAVQITKLRYRWAMFLRMRGDPADKPTALHRISAALRAAPDDFLIQQEKEQIMKWIDESDDDPRLAEMF